MANHSRCLIYKKIWNEIRPLLLDGRSPQAISNRLYLEKKKRISERIIYRAIKDTAYGNDNLPFDIGEDDFKNLVKKYRNRSKPRKTRKAYIQHVKKVSIEERPLEAEERKEVGHWERDLMLGKQESSAAIVFTE